LVFQLNSDSLKTPIVVPSLRPASKVAITNLIQAPVIAAASAVFDSIAEVKLQSSQAKAKIYYTLDGSIPTQKSIEYIKPVTLNNSATIKAKVFTETDTSITTTSRLHKRPNNWNTTNSTQREAIKELLTDCTAIRIGARAAGRVISTQILNA
jgi:hypothetical protein